MKATLEFNLPEEEYEYTAAVKGTCSLQVLDLMLNELRNAKKYNGGKFCQSDTADPSVKAACDTLIDEFQRYIWELRTEHGVPYIDDFHYAF